MARLYVGPSPKQTHKEKKDSLKVTQEPIGTISLD